MKFHLSLVVVLAVLVAACSPPAPAPVSKPDLAMEENAIRDVDTQWAKAIQERNPSAVAAVFASDGVAYQEHKEPLTGPAAIQADVAKRYEGQPKFAISWTTDSILVAESGELAVQTGSYQATGLGPEGEGEDRGRFVTVWKKVGAEWKVAYDIGSTTTPEPPPAKKE